MNFTSAVFLFVFLPVTLVLYFAIKKVGNRKAENLFLILCSAAFYAWGGVSFLLLLLLSSGINYLLGRAMEGTYRKAALWTAVVYNLAVLVFFKYINFIIESILGLPAAEGGWRLNVGMPLGISFFTFQILSYIIDAYRGKVKVQKNFGSLLLYILLFPKLIAGPIVRYVDLEQELTHRTISLDNVYRGLRRFAMGFCKKILLANKMGEIADAVFALQGDVNTGYAWLGIFCYALQIFMDSSSYADMAIGLGEVFGFHFAENFNYPYISKSIKEFWRRWHISLSTWFRDYVYIPLGGSRNGTFQTYRNLMIVFFLTGLWHGASWNFILWGLFYGVFLIAERIGLDKVLEKSPSIVQRIYTLFVVLVGWVFFRAETLPAAISYIQAMFSFEFGNYQQLEVLRLLDLEHLVFGITAVLASTPVFKKIGQKMDGAAAGFLKEAGLCLLFVFSVCYMMGSEFNPFIYFKF